MLPLVCIHAGGVLTLIMAVVHTRFYRLFHWADDFQKITIINQRILYTIHLALLLLFFIIGAISIFFAEELSESTGLAFGLNLLIALFWVWRLTWQLVYFKTEKGKKIPPIGIFLIIMFVILILAYGIPVVLA